MDTPDHNNSKPAGSFGQAKPDIETLGDLIEFVAGQSDIAFSRKRFLLSALRRARALLGNGQADVKAESKSVLQQLDRRAQASGIEVLTLTPTTDDLNSDLRLLGRKALAYSLRVQLAPEDVGRFLR